MKKSPSYQNLLMIAAICLGINILISIGIIGLVLKAVGLITLIWGIVVYFKDNKVVKNKK